MARLHPRKTRIVMTTRMPHDMAALCAEGGHREKLVAVFNLWIGLAETIVQLGVAIAHTEAADTATSRALGHTGQDVAINGDVRIT